MTLTLLGLIVSTGVITGSALGHTLSLSTVSATGYAPADSWAPGLGLGRAILSGVVTGDRQAFWIAVVAIAALSGIVERRWGHVAAAVAFWGSHLLTLAVGAVALVALRHAAPAAMHALMLTRDVGPSAGYAGCVGFLLATQRRRIALPGLAVSVSLLVFSLVGVSADWSTRPAEVSAALSHLAAVPVGFVLALVLTRATGRPTASTARSLQG